jgi:spore coat polysaccharide biosynthesis protein SpsF
MILAILQARMSSRRLPGKVLLSIGGRPMLQLQLERLERCGSIDRLVVATSIQADDDAIAACCAQFGIDCRRGPLDDVLERFRLAAALSSPGHVVRLTADCPLADWQVIDALITLHLEGGYDYTTNALRRTFPHGLDCEIMTYDALSRAAAGASSAHDREHVTPFLYRPENGFRIGHLVGPRDMSFLRWTVDTLDDFRFVEAVYSALYQHNHRFTTEDVIALLAARPELRSICAASQSPEDRRKAQGFWEAPALQAMATNR